VEKGGAAPGTTENAFIK